MKVGDSVEVTRIISTQDLQDYTELSNGGHATLFRGDSDYERFHPMAPALQRMQRRIKQAFDPDGLFNPYRMSRDW